jgi:hypothetical protein
MLLAPHIELRYIDESIGFGTFASRLIPKGTITWVRDAFDQAFSPDRIQAMDPLHRAIIDKYTYVDRRGDFILCWDHGRFVNHSCQPTCLAPGFDFEIAVRDILPGEEVTDDYGMLNIGAAFDCKCRRPGCRGVVTPDDALAYSDSWDERLRAAFPALNEVPQPLWDLVAEKDEVAAVLAGHLKLPSSRKHYTGRALPGRNSPPLMAEIGPR